ncbi:het domain-containing protein [Colletotrichum plurivorum]|uniref:Het domain-containing protein n=1 Tax=Colletotrichum plurivorum TaxID=2175906 RepID=A0A8H6N7C7_9PEZI|nr:het domain-containing protein [Colletotrichum plurivorum]
MPRESTLLERWRTTNHGSGSFLDVVVRVLCSSMRNQHDHPRELLRDERRQAECCMLHRVLERNLVDLSTHLHEDMVQNFRWDVEAVRAVEAAISAAREGIAGQSVVWAPRLDDMPWTGRSWLSETIGNQVPLFTFSSGPDPKRASDACEAERDWSEDHSWIEDTFRATASGFRLFMTALGSVGLGPESMLHGDNIYIIEGGLMPYVLRGSRMMGTSYVEGIMRAGEGEGGILGTDADNAEGLWMSLRDELMRKLGPGDVEERESCLS